MTEQCAHATKKTPFARCINTPCHHCETIRAREQASVDARDEWMRNATYADVCIRDGEQRKRGALSEAARLWIEHGASAESWLRAQDWFEDSGFWQTVMLNLERMPMNHRDAMSYDGGTVAPND